MPKVQLDDLGQYGMIKDIQEQEIPPEAWSDARNVRFTKKGVESVLGDKKVMATGLVEPKWMIQVPPAENPLWVYGDETQLCAYDGVSHADITRAAQPYSGNNLQRWTGSLFTGTLIVNNSVDKPQLWTPFSLDSRMIDLPNWPDTLRAKSVRAFKNFLIALNLTEGANEYPYRIRWSHPARPGSVPASWVTNDPKFDSRQTDLGETDDVIVDSLRLGDMNVIYREKTAWGMQYVGGQSVFRLWNLLEDCGLLWRDCVQAVPMGHAVFGQDDIYVHNGSKDSNTSIVHDKVRKWIFSIISPQNFRNCFTLKNSPEKEVWFCMPEAGATYATLAMMWNWKSGSIGFRDLPETPFGVSGIAAQSDDFSGRWG